jgi:hypothetical protein
MQGDGGGWLHGAFPEGYRALKQGHLGPQSGSQTDRCLRALVTASCAGQGSVARTPGAQCR